MLGCSRGVLDNRHFEAVLQQLAMWASVQRLVDMPASTTLEMPRLRSWSVRSLLSGPYTLWGLTTMVSPSSRYGLYHSSQSAPEPSKPSSDRAPDRSNMLMSCIMVSTVPPNFQP